MLRILLLTLVATAVLPSAAHAAVLSNVSGDTLAVTGDGAADQITLRLSAPDVLQVNGSTFNRTTFSRIAVRPGAGADEVRIDESGGVFTDTEITTIETGAGADVVSGGSGAEVIVTGDDGDFVSPGAGDDAVQLGAGDDTVLQHEGDARDLIEGQAGLDTLRVLGTGQAEEFTVQAFGNRALFTRDTSAARADVAGVETAEVNAAAGGDLIDVGNLEGTGIVRVDADAGVADGARDQIAFLGRATVESISVTALDDVVQVFGAIKLHVENAAALDDRLTLFGSGGSDSIVLQNAVAPRIGITLDGGAGSDTLVGNSGTEVLRGGPGFDVADGGFGDDVIDLGDGDDLAHWSPGDGNDIIEGGSGAADQLRYDGNAAAEKLTLMANGARARFTRDLESVVLDMAGIERIDALARSGADRITVGDLTGTGITTVKAEVGNFGGDNATDEVTVTGTAVNDQLTVTAPVTVGRVSVANAEARDKLTINGLGGDDVIDTRAVPGTGVRVQADGGDGADTLLGGAGDDVHIGGNGSDVLFTGSGDNVALGGAGDDVLRGEEGDDVLDGGAHDDILIGNAGDDVLLNGEVVFDE